MPPRPDLPSPVVTLSASPCAVLDQIRFAYAEASTMRRLRAS